MPGKPFPTRYVEIFDIRQRSGEDRAIRFIRERWAIDEPIHGYEVDDCVRGYITEKGYGDYFIHRTGHNIGTVIHGNGVNLDNLETRDARVLISGVCFSIEPGDLSYRFRRSDRSRRFLSRSRERRRKSDNRSRSKSDITIAVTL